MVLPSAGYCNSGCADGGKEVYFFLKNSAISSSEFNNSISMEHHNPCFHFYPFVLHCHMAYEVQHHIYLFQVEIMFLKSFLFPLESLLILLIH